jgi:outer membrane cobalamin receptor
VRPYSGDHDSWITSLAVQDEIPVVANLALVLGYGRHRLDVRDGGDGGDEFLVGTAWHVAGGTRLRASVSRKVRFPTLVQLYDERDGNPDLEPETALTWEAGLERRWDTGAALGVAGFVTRARDFIERLDDTRRFENHERYDFAGLELTGEARPGGRLTLRAAYAYLDSEDRSPGTPRDELQYRPRHSLSLQAGYAFPFGLSAHGTAVAVLDQVFYSNEEPLQQGELDDYGILDVRLEQRVAGLPASAYLGVDNLLDEAYEQSYGLPQAGRVLYGGLELRY